MPTKAELQADNDDLRTKLEEVRAIIDDALEIEEEEEEDDDEEDE